MKTLAPYFGILVALLLLARRTRVARRVRPWVILLVLGALTLSVGFYVWGHAMVGPHVDATGAAIILVSLALGVALGAVASRLIHLHRDPDTGHAMARLSLAGLGFIAGLVVLKLGAKHLGLEGDEPHPFSLVSDALFALAMGTVFARQILLLKRARALGTTGHPTGTPT